MRALLHRLLTATLSLSLALTPAVQAGITTKTSEDLTEAAFHSRINAASVEFDPDSPITIGATRDPFITSAHPAGWLGDGESGHMALADSLLGLSPPKDDDPADGQEPSDWRIDMAEYGVAAALPEGVGYEYLQEVAARTGTTLEEIILLDYSHLEVHRQLSPAFKALLTIVITQGMGLSGAFNLAGNLGLVTTNAAGAVTGLTAFGTAVNAFAVSLSVGVIDGAVSGNLDIGQLLEGAVFSGLTAGLTAGINANDFGIVFGKGAEVSLLGVGDNFTLAALVEGGIDAAIKAGLNSAVYGTDFGQAFLDSLSATVTSALLADVQTFIGDQGLTEGSAGHMLLHGLAGCAFQEVSGGDCRAGFAAGIAASLYAGTLDINDPNFDRTTALNTAELLGAFAGFVFSSGQGENVSLGGQVSQSGVENNYLTHAQWDALLSELEACAQDASCDPKEILAHYSAISQAQNEALINCIAVGDTQCVHDALADLRELDSEYSSIIERLIYVADANSLGIGPDGELSELFGLDSDGLRYGEIISYNPGLFDGALLDDYLAFAAANCSGNSNCMDLYAAERQRQWEEGANSLVLATFGILGVVLTPQIAAACLASPTYYQAYIAFEAAGTISDLAACANQDALACAAAAIPVATTGGVGDELIGGAEVLYRGDSRGPEEIFEEGFQPRAPGSDTSLEDYVDYNQPSNYVGTTTNVPTGTVTPGSPEDFATNGGTAPGFVYQIDPPATGINVNDAYPDGPFTYENEVVIPGGVPSNCIIGCIPIGPSGQPTGPFIPNPNYTE